MSVTPEQSAEALNGMFKFGQSLAAGFFDYLGKQNAAFQQAAPAQHAPVAAKATDSRTVYQRGMVMARASPLAARGLRPLAQYGPQYRRSGRKRITVGRPA